MKLNEQKTEIKFKHYTDVGMCEVIWFLTEKYLLHA